MLNFCTLFDVNYIDKALAMYKSLVRVRADFMLYVLCLDEYVYQVLENMQLDKLVLAHLWDFETPELLKIKKHRTKPEYCWTCTAASLEYFMNKYQLPDLTYIDADLYFYSNPQVLFDEIADSKADVAIMEHRFDDSRFGRESMKSSGKYCVEFNYFNNSKNSREALTWWKESCFDWCYQKYEPAHDGKIERYGDQKYLEQFQHIGAGVAPWNLSQYRLGKKDGFNIELRLIATNEPTTLVFYHFQNLKYITNEWVNINSQCKDKDLKYSIYYPYLIEVTKIRQMLEKEYSLSLDVKKSYSSNKVKAFVQRHIMPYRLRVLSDLINLKKIIC